VKRAQRSCERYELSAGVYALPGGLLWLQDSRSLLAADAHFAYEEVIGGALPLWSTAASVGVLGAAASSLVADEIILLGDVIHGSIMSEGAAQAVAAAVASLRAIARVTLLAGNHEGKSRGFAILGETLEELDRDGWRLSHGDRPPDGNARAIVGHLHPSLHLGGSQSVPAFLAGSRLIVMPALTPYSRGLDICSEACTQALRARGVMPRDVQVIASSAVRLFPFGSLLDLRANVRARKEAPSRNRFHRPHLQPDL